MDKQQVICNAELCLNYFSVNVSVLAVVFCRQISKNQQFYTARLRYAVTHNSPGHERPAVCFLKKVYFITEYSIILLSSLFYHSNDWGCSDIKRLANRIN